jgi:hypothetical protein
MYCFFQRQGKESPWEMTLASDRHRIVSEVRPAFTTILDLSKVPDDNDWSTVRYAGPLYFDFDADGDLELVCNQFKSFLGKLDAELGFDIEQAKLFCSGSKGFHAEIPQECFIPKVPATGTSWLAYIYREMAQSLMVDTLDLNVYTGKRGRQWRTPNVKRENGCYKVQISVEEALSMDPDLYLQVIQEPRPGIEPTPPSCNAQFAMLFTRSKDKVVTHMRGRKRRMEVANKVLDPWRKAKKTPPTIEKLMAGECVAANAGFQALAMQLSIYATSVDMPLAEFLDRCRGLCENHVSDSSRYGTPDRRRGELTRMYEYMAENALYEFDAGPIVRLLKPGTEATDLGVLSEKDHDTKDEPAEGDPEVVVDPEVDIHSSIRAGVKMNRQGIFVSREGGNDSICRASFSEISPLVNVEDGEFRGYDAVLNLPTGAPKRVSIEADAFTSSSNMRKFMAGHRVAYQGNDAQTMAIHDILLRKTEMTIPVYTYPREGLFFISHPDAPEVKVGIYLTQNEFRSTIPEGDPLYFRLQYKPSQAQSSYKIDLHRARALEPEDAVHLKDLFKFNRPDVVSSMLGWFVAAHFRSAYLLEMKQFPLLQVYGEAGSGKSQTVMMLANLHWASPDTVSIKSAMSCTPFVIDTHFSTSTSAPCIIDEYKPRELKKAPGGKFEKIKDGMKMSYIGGEIGGRGTINKNATNPMSVIANKATAPVVFMGEAVESETAIAERCVMAGLSQQFQTRLRKDAFWRLQNNTAPVSALGRNIMDNGMYLDLGKFRAEVSALRDELSRNVPRTSEGRPTLPERVIYNQAVVIHGLMTLRKILGMTFGSTFDEDCDTLIKVAHGFHAQTESSPMRSASRSEASKLLGRVAMLSRRSDTPYAMLPNKDYLIGDGWVDVRIDRAYDQYRLYCAAVHETPLFDSLDSFVNALTIYSPVTDFNCVSSDLWDETVAEQVVRFSIQKLNESGVTNFRDR